MQQNLSQRASQKEWDHFGPPWPSHSVLHFPTSGMKTCECFPQSFPHYSIVSKQSSFPRDQSYQTTQGPTGYEGPTKSYNLQSIFFFFNLPQGQYPFYIIESKMNSVVEGSPNKWSWFQSQSLNGYMTEKISELIYFLKKLCAGNL